MENRKMLRIKTPTRLKTFFHDTFSFMPTCLLTMPCLLRQRMNHIAPAPPINLGKVAS